ncbi:phosphoglucosamine mutase [Gluconobacter sphaericus]|uniref:Phosphoglucosamine mutase n=1 Tax=Gluconobacter sphaericus NBRC 12467 TaxID=1307951 RepID=A0AA37SD66_9PROT|nr:phosphoglucosamine mutase [Gluconobacter sphaericus]MBF0884602.1 phosphoglucosamine mutase [Gluconobacter sphaericus]MBS1084700.1 phosphoglucosamine mutase [Gluconobacter sphaericus]MBS1099870.1 phosphoglucosamine mutase [Gluconobacter sphaericus]GBR53583.1 phosphoglucosamine mutase [Gluconobacter sphaericus NBRC 12467]GEB41382.1 phosphoglucosamine mutase [Gluconobacter sphaericus NBRC 12467]
MATKRSLFGTDGIRGTANTAPMTVEIAQKLGQAAGLYFMRSQNRRHSVVLGKDTRLSGYMLECALVAGFLSAGMDVILVGPLPTPAIAMLTRSLRADLGVMVSASHNPFTDNGIKLFGPDGFKLSDEVEGEIEDLMSQDLSARLASPAQIGRASRLTDAAGRYIENAKASFPRGLRLDGLKIVIDCANGSAYRVAPKALWELGAEVIKIGCSPDGLNINDGVGSTHPETLCAAVREHGADFGIALDGDADRVLIADENGNLVDGDQIIGLIAAFWKQHGRLRGNTVVTTVMSNIGLEKALAENGLELQRTAVGDRYVVERMREIGANLGGEQSGHMVLSDYATTGDGLIAALQVLAVSVETKRPASEICRFFTPYPQLLKNVRYSGTSPMSSPDLAAAKAWADERLAGSGRLVLRASGTEPLIRVMAEAQDEALVHEVVDHVCDIIRAIAHV